MICPYAKGNLTQHNLIYVHTTGAPSTEAPFSNKNVDPKLGPQYLTPSLQTPVRGSWDHGPSVLQAAAAILVSFANYISDGAAYISDGNMLSQHTTAESQPPPLSGLAKGQDFLVLHTLKLRKLLPQAHTQLFFLT